MSDGETMLLFGGKLQQYPGYKYEEDQNGPEAQSDL
jgi:hypothetical protein